MRFMTSADKGGACVRATVPKKPPVFFSCIAGSRVALVELPMAFISSAEKGGVGGTCVLRGCVPKKLMLYASEFATEMQAAKGFG